MHADDVERLMSTAITTAHGLGFTIADNCQQHLRGHLQGSDLTRSGPGLPDDQNARLMLAHAQVAQYVTAMVIDAIRTGPPADMMLHENNFYAVRAWICPLWPVC